MKAKFLIPMLAMSFSALSLASECDDVIEVYKARGKTTYQSLSESEKQGLQQCLIENPGSETTSTYSSFHSATQRQQRSDEQEQQRQQDYENMINARETKTFASHEINKYGIDLLAMEVQMRRPWAEGANIGNRHSKLVPVSNADSFCQTKGYAKAAEVRIEPINWRNVTTASTMSRMAKVISEEWYEFGPDSEPYIYDKSDDFDGNVEFGEPIVLTFNSIECIRNENSNDKLEDIISVTSISDVNGNEKRLILEDEHLLQTDIKRWLEGEEKAETSFESATYNEDRFCKSGEKFGVNYTYCSTSFEQSEEERESEEDYYSRRDRLLRENQEGNDEYLPSNRLDDRFRRIDLRNGLGTTRQ